MATDITPHDAREVMKIRGEQAELAEERDRLERTLGAKKRLQILIRAELKADAETNGDARRSPLVERETAQAFAAESLLPAEPVTVVLSEKGWERAAKGHEIDPASLGYKAGDSYAAAARGRSNQLAVFLDSSGRSYSLPAHGLPSARGQGEPLAGRRGVRRRDDGQSRGSLPASERCRLRLRRKAGRFVRQEQGGQGGVVAAEGRARAATDHDQRPGERARGGREQPRPYAGGATRGAVRAREGQGRQDHRHPLGQGRGAGGVRGRERGRGCRGRAHDPRGPASHELETQRARVLSRGAWTARRGLAPGLPKGGPPDGSGLIGRDSFRFSRSNAAMAARARP